jgi:hypothetical protein
MLTTILAINAERAAASDVILALLRAVVLATAYTADDTEKQTPEAGD